MIPTEATTGRRHRAGGFFYLQGDLEFLRHGDAPRPSHKDEKFHYVVTV